MKVFYIGHYGEGATSRMRGEYLKQLLSPEFFLVADIDIPVGKTSRVFRSFGWRYYLGPLINNVSKFVTSSVKEFEEVDLIWVDKGVFLDRQAILELRKRAKWLIHFTPDCAFFCNKSFLFDNSIRYYDHCITTKSFEIDLYKNRGAREVHFCTQGYDPGIHFPRVDFEEKSDVIFVGLCEPSREELIEHLIESGIDVSIAGKNWGKFARKHKDNDRLKYLGEGYFGDEYAKLISGYKIGLGLLSKNFPELHTTRTFEIPACGTVLATEGNFEIRSYFDEMEVIYFTDKIDLSEKIKYHLANPAELQKKLQKATNKLDSLKVDYPHILSDLLKRMDLK